MSAGALKYLPSNEILCRGNISFRDLKEIFPLQRISFEGRYFNAPVDTDAYLKRLYGDYMKLPDRDKREIHTIKKEML